MQLLSCLSVGAFALTANSFLIPGDLKDFSVKGFAHPDTTQPLQEEKIVNLDCSSCPYALNSERNGGHEWTNDVASDLEMKIDSDGDTLRLNGVSFYPIQAPGLPPQLHVAQKKKEDETSTMEGYPADLRMSYSLEFEEKKADDGSSLVTVVMTIMGLDGEMVKIDNLEVKAIKDTSGKVYKYPCEVTGQLLIPWKLILVSAVPVPIDPNSADAKCGNVVCRVFTKIITGIKKAKASAKNAGHRVKCFCVKCFQRLAGHVKNIHPDVHNGSSAPRLPDDTVQLPTHHKFRPGMADGHPHHHHGHHHRKGFMHRMGHIMWATVRLAFVPVLIGVAFGMAASAIGMLVGQLVVFLWMRYRKDERIVYEPVYADEKNGLPAYEDVPAAEAVTEKEVEAKA